MQYLIKILISACLILLVSEISKRNSWFAAVVASLPLVSIISMVWLYQETGNIEKVVSLSSGIFWLVIPSLLLFLFFPLLIKLGLGFYSALSLASAGMVLGYFLMLRVLEMFGVKV